VELLLGNTAGILVDGNKGAINVLLAGSKEVKVLGCVWITKESGRKECERKDC
jgi:hypothetical protein